jgi:hypothetical protein
MVGQSSSMLALQCRRIKALEQLPLFWSRHPASSSREFWRDQSEEMTSARDINTVTCPITTMQRKSSTQIGRGELCEVVDGF